MRTVERTAHRRGPLSPDGAGRLLGLRGKVNDDRLYRALDRLLPHKQALQTHLKNRLGELFELDYDLLLYDVTSTYFEGRPSNPLAAGATRAISGGLQTGVHRSGGQPRRVSARL